MKRYLVELEAGEREALAAMRVHAEGIRSCDVEFGRAAINALAGVLQWRTRASSTRGARQGRREIPSRSPGCCGCGDPPEGRVQWSLRLLADRAVELGYIDSVSHETVRRVLKKTPSNRGGASVG